MAGLLDIRIAVDTAVADTHLVGVDVEAAAGTRLGSAVRRTGNLTWSREVRKRGIKMGLHDHDNFMPIDQTGIGLVSDGLTITNIDDERSRRA